MPDVFVSSKALGGGVPISAVVAKGDIMAEWGPGAHVSTQAGNYVLDVISSAGFLKKVNATGAYFLDGLRELEKKHRIIGHIDNRGIYTGVELVIDRKSKEPAVKASTMVRDRCVEKGLLFEKGGYYHNRLQLIPPLNISRTELDRIISIFDTVFGEAEKKFGIR